MAQKPVLRGEVGCACVAHLLAAGDAGLSDPGEHEALGEVVLGHARHVPCPEQRATREVVLEREDPVRF